MTAPLAAIPAVAQQTLELPGEMTETYSHILSEDDTELTQDVSETVTTTTEATPTQDVVTTASNVVALGALEKTADGPVFVLENADDWEAGTGFYVRVRFLDHRGEETAFAMQYLDAEQVRSWRLDLSQLEALSDGWQGTGLVTVHDGLEDGAYDLSEEHEVSVRRLSPVQASSTIKSAGDWWKCRRACFRWG